MRGDEPAAVEDSALAKLLTYGGLFGFLLYWLSPIFFTRRMSRQTTIYMFGVAIFLSFGFMLSAAIFSIKTAALLWFLYGYLCADEVRGNCVRGTEYRPMPTRAGTGSPPVTRNSNRDRDRDRP